MLTSSLRIYLTANVLIYCLFAVCLFPEGLGWGLAAVVVSLLLSLPALFVLSVYFLVIDKYRPTVLASWLLLIIAVALCVLIPPICLTRAEFDNSLELFYISAGAGFGAILLQSFYLHKYFKSLHHENN